MTSEIYPHISRYISIDKSLITLGAYEILRHIFTYLQHVKYLVVSHTDSCAKSIQLNTSIFLLVLARYCLCVFYSFCCFCCSTDRIHIIICDSIWENQLWVSEKIKSIITYTRKYSFEHEDTNGNQEKEARLTQRRSVRLASNFDDGIFARRKR